MGYWFSVFQTVCAIVCTLTVLVYDLITLCRVIGKMELVEKAFNKFFPNQMYDEVILFRVVRPMMIIGAMMLHIAAYKGFETLTVWGGIHMFLLYSANILSFANLIKS